MHVASGIGAVRVEPGRHEHQLRLPAADQRRDDVLDQRAVHGVARPARDRHVDRVAAPVARAHVARRARAGIQRPLVDRAEQHRRVGVEDVVRPVAVVHVPVEDQHPLDAVRGARVRRADRDVVEEAEAHRAGRLGVVAGRPQRRDAARLAAEQRVDQRDRTARRRAAPPRTCPRPRSCPCRSRRRRAADSSSMKSTCSGGCTRVSCSRVARGASTRSQPNQAWRSISASSPTIRAGRSGWPGTSCARPAS